MGAVIKLPTAAPRKVTNRITRHNLAAFEACAEFPGKPVFEASPYTRRCEEIARLMLDSGVSAAMQIAVGLYATAPAEQQARLSGRLLGLKASKQTGAEEALAWLDYETAPKERKRHIQMAAAMIVQED